MSRSPAKQGPTGATAKKSLATGLYDWMDRRFQIAGLMEFIRHKQVPLTPMAVWYYFGGVTLFLLGIQVVTGLLLLMYYVPTADQAYESVHYIMAKTQFGWLVRSIHVWSANLMILSAFIHLFSVFFMRAYRNPREMTWFSGCALLGISLAFGFSGYLLPWNELSFFATKVGTDIVGDLPVVGPSLLVAVRGGEDVTEATLRRFFGLHVAILPGVVTMVVGLHLLLIQRQGMSRPAAWSSLPPEKRRSMPFFPHFMLRDVLLWLVILNVLAIVAVFFPAPLGVKADPFAAAPAGIKPEWYFLSQYQTLKWIPGTIGPISGELVGMIGLNLAGLAVLFLPFLDRVKEGGPRRRLLDVLGVLALTYLIVMTVLGHVLE